MHPAPVDLSLPDRSDEARAFVAFWNQPQRDNAQSATLITHMARYYSDWHIKNDADSVLSECATEDDREQVEAYLQARRGAPDFNPKFYAPNRRHNSHQPWMTKPAGKPRHCEACRFTLESSRSKFCSNACRQKALRGRQRYGK